MPYEPTRPRRGCPGEVVRAYSQYDDVRRSGVELSETTPRGVEPRRELEVGSANVLFESFVRYSLTEVSGSSTWLDSCWWPRCTSTIDSVMRSSTLAPT